MKKPAGKEKKESRRSKRKYPALERGYNLKTRANLIDYDYLDQLGPKELEWLNAFTSEFINADMNHGGKKLHKSKKLRKDCFDKNNARNRCILTRGQASGTADYFEDVFKDEAEYEEYLRETMDEGVEGDSNGEGFE